MTQNEVEDLTSKLHQETLAFNEITLEITQIEDVVERDFTIISEFQKLTNLVALSSVSCLS